MNIILVFLWVLIILLTIACYYYNVNILNNYVKMNTPTQPINTNICQFENVQQVDIKTLKECKKINDVQGYSYSLNGEKYMISTNKTFYAKACSGFCVSGVMTSGNCKDASEQKLLEKCEALIKPPGDCVSSAKPILSIKDNNKTIYYYINSPINSLNLCSSS